MVNLLLRDHFPRMPLRHWMEVIAIFAILTHVATTSAGVRSWWSVPQPLTCDAIYGISDMRTDQAQQQISGIFLQVVHNQHSWLNGCSTFHFSSNHRCWTQWNPQFCFKANILLSSKRHDVLPQSPYPSLFEAHRMAGKGLMTRPGNDIAMDWSDW